MSVIIFGLCVLWQLFLMNQIFLEKERYRVVIDNNARVHRDEQKQNLWRKYNGKPDRKTNVGLQTTGENEVTHAKTIEYESEDQNAQETDAFDAHRSIQQTMQSGSLLDLSLIRNTLLREAPWAESHGANHLTFLGAGMLYYSMAYSFRSKSIVVLGSGGGFVPRMLRQAQRDLLAGGVRPDRRGNKKNGRTDNSLPSYDLYLVDAHLASAGWGSTFYAKNENTTMRKEFSDIHYVFQLTDDAYTNYFRPMYDDPDNDFKIDYLHVDADHGFEQSWKDFDNYSKLLSDRAVISFHDTCYDNVTRNCHAKGVPETMEKLRNESEKRGLQMIDLHYLYRGIAFAFREHATALETPRDRRINFCVNNADLINVTSDGFTKNGRVGSLPTLGDFMECSTRYNETELMIAKSKMAGVTDPPKNIMAVACPVEGFRRHSVSGRCEKCIPGLIGDNCQRSKYEAVRTKRNVDNIGDERDTGYDYSDLLHLAGVWLRSLSFKPKSSSEDTRSSLPRSVMEIGPSAWKVPNLKSDEVHSPSSPPLLFGSLMSSPSSGSFDRISNIIVVDPVSVTTPLWIDPIVSLRYRFMPCTLKDAIAYDEGEKKKNNDSKSSSLDLDIVDTLVCMSCDDLVSISSSTRTKKFLHSTFPSLHTIIMGFESNELSSEFLKDLTSETVVVRNEREFLPQKPTWRLDRDLTTSLDGGSHVRRKNLKKRLVLLTRTD